MNIDALFDDYRGDCVVASKIVLSLFREEVEATGKVKNGNN